MSGIQKKKLAIKDLMNVIKSKKEGGVSGNMGVKSQEIEKKVK